MDKIKRHPLWSVWMGMKQRCFNKNNKSYKYYGGRGITVCDRWLESLSNFVEDMGERPEGYTLERINVNGDYCPDNCKWASWSEQMRNRRAFGMPPKSEEHKRKISLANKGKTGEKSSFWGRKHSDETKALMSKKAKDKTVYTFSHDIHGVEVCTRSELIEKYNLNDSNMSMLLSGKYKSHKGWKLCKK